MINLIQLVHKWTNYSNDIYSFLSKENPDTYTVAKEQIREEIEKAKIIKMNQEHKQIIHELEDTKFCKGKIDFALHCIDYDSANILTFDTDKLKQIKKIFMQYMDCDDLSDDFRRALFTIGDNKFYEYKEGYLGAISKKKYCIIEHTNDLKNNFIKEEKGKKYLKDLVMKLITDDIIEIINKYIYTQKFENLPNWKKRIIIEEKLLENCHNHYIAVSPDNSCCWLIPYKWVTINGIDKLEKIE
jgi:hypothetical protein